MLQVDVYDIARKKVGTVELRSEVFEAPVRKHLLHEVVNWQLAKRRAGTSSTKTRAEVRGGGAKPWKQKHTGRARAGSRRSPIWRKGGVAFGPKPKDWSYSIPKKVRKGALVSALSSRFGEGAIVVLDSFQLPEVKTRRVAKFMKDFEFSQALVVIGSDNENLRKSARNMPGVKVLREEGLNVYDLLKHKNIVMVRDSVEKIQERLS